MSSADVFYGLAFYVLAAFTLVGALGMVGSTNMVRSALWLVLGLGGVATLYLLLSADFLAIVQLLVYVGAIMVLMLFAIMLTPGQIDLPALAARGQRGLAAAFAVAFFVISGLVMITTPWKWAAQPFDGTTTAIIGRQLLSTFVLPFEIVSVLLTAAMIGALIIAQEEH